MNLNYPEISDLSGLQLERFVAAIFQAQGYFVERNLWWNEPRVENSDHSVQILEADILARFFSPFWESRILIECKGGCTFNDLYKFIGVNQIVKPDASFLICSNSSNFNEIQKIGEENNVVVIRPKDIFSKFNLENQRQNVLYWYWINEIEDSLLDRRHLTNLINTPNNRFDRQENNAYNEIRQYISLIRSEYWKTIDPREQANLLYSTFDDNKDFVRSIGRTLELNPLDTENAIASHILCESAANVVLIAKLSYLVAAIRCAINSLISTDPNYLSQIEDVSFKNAVEKMLENISVSCRLPQFIKYLSYQWGGVLEISDNVEISIMAKQFGERIETVRQFIDVLDETFSIILPFGSVEWGIKRGSDEIKIKGVPDSFRGFGMYLRNNLDIDTSKYSYYPFSFQWLQKVEKVKDCISI